MLPNEHVRIEFGTGSMHSAVPLCVAQTFKELKNLLAKSGGKRCSAYEPFFCLVASLRHRQPRFLATGDAG
jgi:hypothetical protein